MEENQNSQQPQFKCSGDCATCRKKPIEQREQWMYCAAQRTWESLRMVEAMQRSLEAMQGTIDKLEAKIEAIQNSEINVLDPTQPSNIPANIPENIGRTVGSPIAQ